METDKLLYRIFLGYYYIYINNSRYKIIYPDLHTKYEAEFLYEQIIEDNKFEKVYLNENEIKMYLQINNIWTATDEERLKNCEKFLEESKVQLYLNYMNEKNRTTHKKNIKKSMEDLIKLNGKKNSFSYLTIKDHATSIKNEFLIMKSIYDSNSNLVFDDPGNNYDFEYHKLELFIREILEQAINPTQLRAIAKSDLWKSYAVASNLEKDILLMNDDFRHLLNLHKMYESVKQHPESPNQQIIDDDDALDGWFIFQNKKAEKEKKKNAVLDKFGGNKLNNANEVFLLTNDIQERNEIYDLNDIKSRQEAKEIIKLGENKKDMKWQEIPFVQRDIQLQAQEKMVTHQRGK